MPALPSSLLLPLGGEWVAGYLEVGVQTCLLLSPLQISRREHGGEGLQLDKGAGRLPWLKSISSTIYSLTHSLL